MAELVHHTDESADGGVSPFDTAIRDIVTDEDALIACPYITLGYLESVLESSTSWRLLTNVEAWLDNYRTSEREAIREFVARHHDRIHDVRNLHAKAVIGETSALVGSANLTRTGLGRRDELGVRFDETGRIAELREWFDGLWNESSSAKLDDIDERIRTSSPVPNSAKGGGSTAISSDSRRVNASLTKGRSSTQRTDETGNTGDEDAHRRITQRVGKAPSRDWINQYFNLFEELLAVTGLAEEDPILVASIPKSGGVNITVNHRYVLTAMRTARNRTEYILSDETENLDQYIEQATEHYRFENRTDEPGPHLVAFEERPQHSHDAEFKRGWKLAMLNEVENRWQKAPKRDSHEPLVYRAAVDYDYRQRVLNEAFGGA